MDLEETKKIIQNKIEADESAREVRSQIKTYIHEKQNLREGFTETFKPLIETSEKVKESIDTQQNKLIKQLQENQLALTQGFEGNRLAITSGFDKMDEVKRSDLLQLPGFEAIEHPEMKKTSKPEIKKDEVIYKISNRDLNKISGFKAFDENDDAFCKKEDLEDFLKRNNFYEKNEYDIFEKYLQPDLIKIEIEPKLENDPIFKISLNDFFRITGQENKIEENGENEIKEIKESELNRILSEDTDTNKYRIDIEKKSKIVQVINKPKTLIYDEKDMNKFLDEDDKKRLIFYGLKFPGDYKDVRMEEFQKLLKQELKKQIILKEILNQK